MGAKEQLRKLRRTGELLVLRPKHPGLGKDLNGMLQKQPAYSVFDPSNPLQLLRESAARWEAHTVPQGQGPERRQEGRPPGWGAPPPPDQGKAS